ncbi:AraC family transcriptional regulator of arabinose operon [Friedmanniella endophytica]|uniref:AraC family transcriptional regulator of arabinose operon n=1 Tax=Microlunatus kandeliicorticis TaxID=1759536 RepID=A0A7W3IS61_9ACTN|nr:helix-turn-helix domain-containing protein [Microlunatus kandeliicorticis]MBA8794254.1 AraC family transcriptional regulator of arabinose operon [Microlunatus kandeliicorticis]
MRTHRRPRVEALIPQFDRLEAGRFAEGPAYDTWRSRGTEDWLVIHTVGGRGRFGYAGGEVESEPGDLVLLAPRTLHDYGTADGAGEWLLQFAHFHPRTEWLPLLDWPLLAPGLGRIRVDGEAGRRVREAFDQTVTLSRSGLARAELFGLNALEQVLLWASTQRPGSGRTDPRLITVLELISTRLAEPLTVAGLAAAVGLSASRLTHLFSEQLGLSPRDFLEQQRMQAAAQLLRLTGRTVTEVAAAVGYDDPLYFSTRFRRFSGRSPSAFRSAPGRDAAGRGG